MTVRKNGILTIGYSHPPEWPIIRISNECDANGKTHAEPYEGPASFLLSVRGRAGGGDAFGDAGDGSQPRFEFRLLVRGGAVASIGSTFGERIASPFAERSTVRVIGGGVMAAATSRRE